MLILNDLAAVLAESCGITKKTAVMGLTAMVDHMAKELVSGNPISVTGLGAFTVVQKPSRKARNPKTGETVMSKPYRKLTFKPSVAYRKIAM